VGEEQNSYHRDENDVYDIADYYQYDFGRKNSVGQFESGASGGLWRDFLSALWRDYWGKSGSNKDYQLGYSNTRSG
jgi:outer membrane usher protein